MLVTISFDSHYEKYLMTLNQPFFNHPEPKINDWLYVSLEEDCKIYALNVNNKVFELRN